MKANHEKACLKLYTKYYEKRRLELTTEMESRSRSGIISEENQSKIETESQKFAIRTSILEGMKKYSEVPVANIWDAIFKAHMFRKSGILDKNIIDRVVSADQSWKKSSGHAFEEMIRDLAGLNLKGTGVSVVLQKDLTLLIRKGKVFNEPRDISWLKEQAKKNIFDLYAIITEGEKMFCFGCIQAKTSIRDRVTRDREPSIHAMQSYFWSSVLVLDGAFLKMPKFNHMVNGGDSEFPQNGWHGMYVFSEEEPNDRIYHTDLQLSVFKEHLLKAAKDWRTQRQWMTGDWRADNIQ